MARSMSKIVKYRDYLTERIDPDTLLDCLLAKTMLSKREVNKVKSRPTIFEKNERLLDYIIAKDNEEEFMNALRDAKQQHLANYILNDGVRRPNTLEDWPLEEAQIRIIDVNCGSLKDLIDMRGGLVDELLAKRVISHRQKQLICSKATDSEKNDAFLDILRRGSIRDYKNTIQSLRDSNQEHIAEVLHEGGVVLPVHFELQEPLAEVRLVEIFEDLLRGRTVEEFNRIVEMKKHKVIAAKLGHSIIFYYYCKTSKLWRELKKSISSGSLKVTIEELCKRMDSQTNVVIKTIHIRAPDYEEIDRYFASKGNRCAHRSMLLLSIILACIGIISGIADIYARQTFPCYTKQLECQEAKDRTDVIQSVRERFTLNFEQMQNATSELLKAVKENPNNDEFVSLVLKLYETPNEEIRQKIAERLRQVEKELTDRAAKRKKIIKNPMENVINMIGKVSFKIKTDVFQLAEDLLSLVNETLTAKEDSEEPVTTEVLVPVPLAVIRILQIQFLLLQNFVPQPYFAIPGPPETDKQEIYAKTLTEKLTAVENWMQETVLVLIELIEENEGLNHLLRKILENFEEDNDEVCSDIPDIKESQTRGFRELHTGLSRLTCLLDDTLKMARLVKELNVQATSLKQDADHLVEEVNEFAKQSIPYLLATLLTVTQHEMPNRLKKPR